MAVDFGTKSFSGLGIHVSVLWVVVFFILVTICVTAYGGVYKGLGRREFPETTVHGDLFVREDLRVDRSLQVNGAAVPGFFNGLNVTTASGTANVTLSPNTLNVSQYNGTDDPAVAGNIVYTLPPAKTGNRTAIVLEQTFTGISTLTMDCAGTDRFSYKSIVPSVDTITGLIRYDTSEQSETSLVLTPAAATTNLIDAGSVLYFACTSDGLWQVDVNYKPGITADFTALTGTLEFAA